MDGWSVGRVIVVASLLVGACSPAGGDDRPSRPTAPTPSTSQVSSSSVTASTLVTTASTAVATTTSVTLPDPTSESLPPEPTLTEEYRPGLTANLFLPRGQDHAPLVVMVPGGGWRTADPTGFAQLAARLAGEGAAALTVEVSSAEDGATYPTPVEDIHCAVAYGLGRLADAGITPAEVILLGHSSGAHLAALASATPETRLPRCAHPTRAPDSLVGLAGVYDVTRLPALAYLLFGATPEEDPDLWEEGNPLLRAASRPEVPVLLLHGAADPLVPVSFTEDFAAALEEGGHDTTVNVVSQADHSTIYAPEEVGDIITEWLDIVGSSNGE